MRGFFTQLNAVRRQTTSLAKLNVELAELEAKQKAGAVGEICGWAYDRDGRLIEGITNDRVASAPLPSRERSHVVALAMGPAKLPGIRAAVTRRLVNGLITDEATASALLED